MCVQSNVRALGFKLVTSYWSADIFIKEAVRPIELQGDIVLKRILNFSASLICQKEKSEQLMKKCLQRNGLHTVI